MRGIILVILLLASGSALAGPDISLQLNLTSAHIRPQRDYNTDNRGIGIQADWTDGHRISSLAAGELINSLDDLSWYVGTGYRYRFGSLDAHADIGAFVGIIRYQTLVRDIWPALVPLVELGTTHVSAVFVYLPKMYPAGAAAVLLQMRIGF